MTFLDDTVNAQTEDLASELKIWPSTIRGRVHCHYLTVLCMVR